MNLDEFGIILMSFHAFLHFLTFVHVQNSRNMLFPKKKERRLRQAETPLKKLGGTRDNTIQYNTIQYPQYPHPPHPMLGGEGGAWGSGEGILEIMYCIVWHSRLHSSLHSSFFEVSAHCRRRLCFATNKHAPVIQKFQYVSKSLNMTPHDPTK